ncbi:MAG: uncharacterized membrane protein YciS (DUF1049 family) [Candidatus Azotimanducaceae bacterium]|jgi:uncharacterized membrane protein YciS (DUF1049 family)
MATTRDTLDSKIQAVLTSATDLPDDLLEPGLTKDLIDTFNGRHSWVMKWGLVKMALAAVAMVFFAYQFFQQAETMAMIAYATGAILCAVAYAAVFNFIWVQMNHNTNLREIKRLELQIALLTRSLTEHNDKEAV